MLFCRAWSCGVLTPSRLKPYSPYPLARTGGEKYSDFSDSGAVAIRLRAQGERNLVFFQRLSRYGYAGTGGEKPGFCSYPVAMAICRW